MAFTRPFTQITAKDVAEAGGKGASLGEMMNAGIIVPTGFVVLASAFDRFLEETDLNTEIDANLARVNYQDTNSVDRYSNVIRDLIHDAAFPDGIGDEIVKGFTKLKSRLVAVRSSATAEDSSVASWAGELESYLNTTRKTLLANVQSCWSSLYTPRAIFYRHEKKLLKKRVSVAVVIQTMVKSEISGITFTVHPVTEDTTQMIIEAGWGLGEAIVSGQITPDSYVIKKKPLAIFDVNVALQERMIVKSPKGSAWKPVPKAKQSKQKLPSKQILTVARQCLLVEKHYGFPCDIEWAMAKGKVSIVQSRPITTLK